VSLTADSTHVPPSNQLSVVWIVGCFASALERAVPLCRCIPGSTGDCARSACADEGGVRRAPCGAACSRSWGICGRGPCIPPHGGGAGRHRPHPGERRRPSRCADDSQNRGRRGPRALCRPAPRHRHDRRPRPISRTHRPGRRRRGNRSHGGQPVVLRRVCRSHPGAHRRKRRSCSGVRRGGNGRGFACTGVVHVRGTCRVANVHVSGVPVAPSRGARRCRRPRSGGTGSSLRTGARAAARRRGGRRRPARGGPSVGYGVGRGRGAGRVSRLCRRVDDPRTAGASRRPSPGAGFRFWRPARSPSKTAPWPPPTSRRRAVLAGRHFASSRNC